MRACRASREAEKADRASGCWTDKEKEGRKEATGGNAARPEKAFWWEGGKQGCSPERFWCTTGPRHGPHHPPLLQPQSKASRGGIREVS